MLHQAVVWHAAELSVSHEGTAFVLLKTVQASRSQSTITGCKD